MNSEPISAGMKDAGRRQHLNIRVEGIVQGVGYRWWCCVTAASLGLKGFVRNEDDGSVYIEAEGIEDALVAFQTLCRRGPRAADVKNVSTREGSWKDFRSFEARHG